MAITLTKDDFLALGRQLIDAAIAAFQQALAAHASTVNVPAPTAHPMIETIVRQHGGQYVVADPPPADPPRDLAAELDALKATLVGKAVISEADLTAAAAAVAAPRAPAQPATMPPGPPPASAGT
jgi:hypothetical protein